MADERKTVHVKSTGWGCLGSILAAVLSASLNHSFWWGVLHFWCSWVYVLYALLCRSKEILPALRAMYAAALLDAAGC